MRKKKIHNLLGEVLGRIKFHSKFNRDNLDTDDLCKYEETMEDLSSKVVVHFLKSMTSFILKSRDL